MNEKFTGDTEDHEHVKRQANVQLRMLITEIRQTGLNISRLGCGIHGAEYADMSDRGIMVRQTFGEAPGEFPVAYEICPNCLRKSILLLDDMKKQAKDLLDAITPKQGS